MLGRFGETSDPIIADLVAKTCLLLPDAVSDLDRVQRLADRTVIGTEQHGLYSWFAMVKGLADYRAGKPASAIDWLKRVSRKTGDQHRDATVSVVLAMAHHRLGQHAAAAEALAEAEAIIAASMPDPDRGEPFGGDWHDWLHSQILFREAEALLNTKDKEE